MPSCLRLMFAGLLSVSVLAVGLKASGLEFERTRISHQADFAEKAYEAIFEFSVTGDSPVQILGVSSTCGCTVASLAKQSYKPGERDILRALFTYGSRTGNQHKNITVSTDQGSVELTLSVEIPVKWRTNTRSLFWQEGEERSPKKLEISVSYDLPARFEEVSNLSDFFSLVSVETDETGSNISVLIAPVTSNPTGVHRAEVSILTAGGERLLLPLYLRAL